ncbi:probable aminoacyl tRNA synthase complex-interacting multifunctional protein 2 isoform X1 [Drosophila grimshawi]|uniref:probable aminoacyl tRNA synthase complex-interacting multifunctional protein 2 isoform X1 n=1 Tax=Drosophila grimshawi TaxID=7222 RepID=UPI000C871273|nr:probable aminoacyl tRNA synthase complex-interacting multifunctional protein 2 isoform X1 [Drosophila grimshawi]XP_043071346.1 probable aminoacyl tRNA synthase complex-interacting multifunctional protein 2 isoform X1 [Drosophila grimshawi]
MYELKTLLPQFDIKLPTCMYELRNVSLSAGATPGPAKGHRIRCSRATENESNISKSVNCALDLDILGRQIQHLLKHEDTNAVVERQEKVLKQLEELKAQLGQIRKSLGVRVCGKTFQHTTAYQNGGLKEEPLHDVVVNGHPNFIPYALLALKNAWRDLYTIDVKTFTHSTMADIGPAAHDFEAKLAKVAVNAALPKINVTLIWKNCEHTEMISSPTMYVPIYGEVNIIRYLGRVGPNEYRYESSPLCNEIDAVLDICYQLLRCSTHKSQVAMVRLLDKRLQQQQYFGGDQMSVADIGVYSSLIRMPAITEKDLTPALLAWRKRAKLITQI